MAALWIGALVVALVLGSLGGLLDGPDDVQAAADMERMREISAQLDATERRLARASSALCAGEAGKGAQARWTPDGELVCSARPPLYLIQVVQR